MFGLGFLPRGDDLGFLLYISLSNTCDVDLPSPVQLKCLFSYWHTCGRKGCVFPQFLTGIVLFFSVFHFGILCKQFQIFSFALGPQYP